MGVNSVLLATLGTAPQVVLLAFRLLSQRQEKIKRAIVFHTRSPQVLRAVQVLKRAWPEYAGDVPLDLVSLASEDLDSEEALRQAYGAVREALHRIKEENLRAHLCIAGGRKPLALVAFLTAQFLFGPEDRVWYLYSPPELEEAGLALVLPEPKVRLVELPVPVWTELPLFLSAIRAFRDPWTAAQAQRALIRQSERRHWEEFFQKKLTPAEQEVVRVLVMEGGSNAAIAKKLGKSRRTVGHQLASIYQKLRAEVGLQVPVNRTTVASLFAPLLREIGHLTDAPRFPNGHDVQRR